MPLNHRLACLLCLLLPLWLAWTAPAFAAAELESISLHNRPAEQIIPLLHPHLEAGEALTGQGFQLILRARAERVKELKGLIAQLDAAPARLRISVRRASVAEIERDNRRSGAGVRVDGDGTALRGRVTIQRTETRSHERDTHRVSALEGEPAYIAEGLAFPSVGSQVYIINGREVISNTVEYRQLESGFYALARINGDQVTVTASPKQEALSPRGGGLVESEALVTTVRGPVGQWLELGGRTASVERRGSGVVHRTESKEHEANPIWIKVDVLEGE
ncbi:hypothetical protein TspCOW1_06400 [Thiohalobacter sp. COW1]|uniref:NolW-like domain-containing protein n=1 Tax=Thiohalobacter thiocyanaticus TaxID=585455 RepID=A0A1Z4VT70_9GAMM|nr:MULTISPECIES: hypothetical protein [Thiohalobacter]BAZ94394.1 uncharacterized protein FOKN1_2014 [Thiohalobacter thiocyanaticus]BCO30537.1 hypothetical protein TspCOW1_06400 [Thiohalobacter sp. COW1]